MRRACRTLPRCTRSEHLSPSVLRASPHEMLPAPTVLSRMRDDSSPAHVQMGTAPNGLAGDTAYAAPARKVLPPSPSELERSPSDVERSPFLPEVRRRRVTA